MYKGNESNLECLDEVAEQLNPWHLVANKAIHTQKETEVYMHTHAKRNRSIYAKRTLHVADANANAFATAFDLALPSCRYTRVEESTIIALGIPLYFYYSTKGGKLKIRQSAPFLVTFPSHLTFTAALAIAFATASASCITGKRKATFVIDRYP